MKRQMYCLKHLNNVVPVVIRTILNMDYYAVAKGRKPGIYRSWTECEAQVKGFKHAKYKKFKSENEAKTFIYTATNINVPVTGSSFLTNSRSFQTKPRDLKPGKSRVSNSTVLSFTDIRKSDTEFEDISDIQDQIISKMNELDSDIIPALGVGRKCTTCKSDIKTTKRKAILIDPMPNTGPAKKQFCTDSIDVLIKQEKMEDFTVDDAGFVEVFTDGSCKGNGTAVAKAGIGVYFGRNHPLNVGEPVSGRATNNCGEIQAATKAIHSAHSQGIKKLCIKSDSKFVIDSMTKWIVGWKKNGWITATGQPVKNERDFKELDEATKLLEVKWVYVPAHSNILGNEEADKLAKDGADKYQESTS